MLQRLSATFAGLSPNSTFLAAAGFCMFAATASAATDPWFFESGGDRLLHNARLARTRLDFGTASALRDAAGTQDPGLIPE